LISVKVGITLDLLKTMLDLNGDGKIDGDDAEKGFDKVSTSFIFRPAFKFT
jgi:hypothetical protein